MSTWATWHETLRPGPRTENGRLDLAIRVLELLSVDAVDDRSRALRPAARDLPQRGRLGGNWTPKLVAFALAAISASLSSSSSVVACGSTKPWSAIIKMAGAS